jgi:glucose-6-phosphate isomerase
MRIVCATGADLAALIRSAANRPDATDSLVIDIDANRSPLDLALGRATIAPLAIELAPGVRVNAVVVMASADPAAVDAAIAFLEHARSTTGQIIEIS